MSTTTSPYTVTVTLEDGRWLADVDAIPAHTFARTLGKLRERVADAIALWEEGERIDRGERDPQVDRGSVEFRFEYALPAKTRRLIAKTRAGRGRAREAAAAAGELSELTVKELSALEISHRDIAEILGLSPARVGQLSRAR
jgi:predicted RNase H-like HicB family nuclease